MSDIVERLRDFIESDAGLSNRKVSMIVEAGDEIAALRKSLDVAMRHHLVRSDHARDLRDPKRVSWDAVAKSNTEMMADPLCAAALERIRKETT